MIRTQILLLFWWLDEIRDQLNFPYKIAAKIPKIANYFQTKNKFDENSTFNSFKYQIKQIQFKKFQYLSKTGKFLSFFDFHNESYSILFTHFFDFKRKWFHMCRANKHIISSFTSIRFIFLYRDNSMEQQMKKTCVQACIGSGCVSLLARVRVNNEKSSGFLTKI